MGNFNTDNIIKVVDSLNRYGINNKHVQLGILATISKESAFTPKTEISYANTPASRIRMIWPSLFKGYSDAQIDALKKNNVAFFDHVYNYAGNPLGNTQAGDGWKYVGRGFNGITGRYQYGLYGKLLGIDLLAHPEKLNDPKIAADANALYFKRRFSEKSQLLKYFGISSVDGINSDETGLKVALNANAGWGKNMNDKFHIENEKRALQNIDFLRQFVGITDKKKMIIVALIIAGVSFFVLHYFTTFSMTQKILGSIAIGGVFYFGVLAYQKYKSK